MTTFYDEDDNFHIHDPNGQLSNCMCSNGHVFQYKEFYGCIDDDCEYAEDKEDCYIVDGHELTLDDHANLKVVD